jgi:hypothetical protein
MVSKFNLSRAFHPVMIAKDGPVKLRTTTKSQEVGQMRTLKNFVQLAASMSVSRCVQP